MQLFGKSAKIAISSVVVILSNGAGKMTSAAEIAEAIQESATYVSKVLQELVKHGILGSRRGVSGGFFLKRAPLDVTLWELVQPFEAGLDDQHCMIDGGRVCDDGNVCGMHPYWDRINREIVQMLKETTVFELWRHSVRNPERVERETDAGKPDCGEGGQDSSA